jgi:hypothetical protein
MSTRQTQQPHQTQHQFKDAPAENAPSTETHCALAPELVTEPPPQARSSQPSKQTGYAVFYLLGQFALLWMALLSAKNFQIALGWVVLSLAFTQVMADSVQFTRPNLKKWIVGACTIIPGLIALASAYIG